MKNDQKQEATFLASFPSIQSAIKIAGDGGMRIQLDIPESHISEALAIMVWRDQILEVTIKPQKKSKGVSDWCMPDLS